MNEQIYERIVEHKFVHQLPLPEHTSSGFEYLVGANGVFARAIRPGLEVLMPISFHQQSIRGLQAIDPYLKVSSLVPEALLTQMWRLACLACAEPEQKEVLFHVLLTGGRWELVIPEQIQSATSCTPTQIDAESSAAQAVIEIHSHGHLPAFFSATDDQDERNGFRVYGVIGKVRSPQPEIVLRVGLFGQGWHVPVEQVFDINGQSLFQDQTHDLWTFYAIGDRI